MPIADRYVHTLVLHRASPGPADRTGHSEHLYLEANYAPFMGNLQERTGVEVLGPSLGGTIVADAVCFAPLGLAPTEHDQIAHGSLLYDVVFVKRLEFGSANDHLEVLCRSIRSGGAESGS